MKLSSKLELLPLSFHRVLAEHTRTRSPLGSLKRIMSLRPRAYQLLASSSTLEVDNETTYLNTAIWNETMANGFQMGH